MDTSRRQRTAPLGLTLVELLIGIVLLVGGGAALLLGMHFSMIHTEYLGQLQTALLAAQGRLESLAAADFGTLWTDPSFAEARGAGQCTGMGEDLNCNGALDAGEDADGDGALDEPLAGGRLAVQIRAFPAGDLNPRLLDLHVAACWTSRGRRIGEDLNCNGALDAGEDADGDGWVDSPAMVSTRVSRP